jgi:fatty acid amide hydrolase 2
MGLGTDFGGSIRLPAFFNGVFGHKPTACLVPHTGHYPYPNDRGSRMLGIGPLARRAEDLMPFLRAIAGPDGRDGTVRGRARRSGGGLARGAAGRDLRRRLDPAGVARASKRAHEGRQGGRGRRGRGAPRVVAGDPHRGPALPGGGSPLRRAARAFDRERDRDPRHPAAGSRRRSGRSAFSTPILLALALESASGRLPERLERRAAAAERALAEDVAEAIGDGVLLHPPFARVAPRHGRTVGRPWVLAPQAIFNLLGLPATEVPMGLGERRLPLGVQVAAGRDRDHVAIAVALELERAFGGWVPPIAAAHSATGPL